MEHWVGQGTLSREQLLAAAGLHVEYTRAEGDWLWMDDGQGGQTQVLDLVGGFGSSLLGHHHPEIRSVMQSCLDAHRPVHAQGSQRRLAADLKLALADYLQQHTGHDYQVCLLNTGTEAVEAALKHAVLAYTKRVQRMADHLAANVRALHTRIERGEASVDEPFLRACEPLVNQEPLANIDQLLVALAAHNQRVLSQEPFVAAFEYAFHGKTMGSLAVTWNRDARLPFLRNNPNAVFITDPAEFLATLQRRQDVWYEFAFEPLRLQARTLLPMAALIYEPLRGEGGVLDLEAANADLLRTLQKHHPEVPVIADEIQCGLGRTGRPVESSALGLPNDYLTFAKSLGGGMAKVSALAVRSDLYHPEFGMLHTSTFADDDLSSALGKRTLEIIQRDGVAARSALIGDALIEGLLSLQRRYPRVLKAVRGRGCMLGIELQDFSEHPSAVLSSLADEKLLGVLCAGHLLHRHRVRMLPSMGRRHVLRLQPSAYLQPEQIQQALAALQLTCELLDSGAVAALTTHMVGGGPLPDPHFRSAPHPGRKADTTHPAERVGFIAHLIDHNSLRQWDPSLAAFTDDQLGELRLQMQQTGEPRTVARRRLRSPFGREVELVLYGVMMDSEAIEIDMRFNKSELIRRHVRTAYRQARLDGCSLVGFGGYTSIVTANCTEFDHEHPAVTTGNSLTVATNIASMKRTAHSHGIVLPQAHIAIVGAAGNIGHVHATLLAPVCARLTLIGRPGSLNRLRAVADDVVRDLCREVTAGASVGALQIAVQRRLGSALAGADEALRLQIREDLIEQGLLTLAESPGACLHADIVVCASNSATPILQGSCFAPGKPVLICDLAIPGDVHKASVARMPNLKLIRGGVVNLPLAPDFNLPGMMLDPGQIYACAGETLLLGLAGMRVDFSKGAVQPAQVREIETLAHRHGFELDQVKLVSGF